MMFREAHIRPPMLDGTNYSYWKTRMRAYIKSIDEKAWKNILVRWSPPTVVDENGNVSVKDELTWTLEEAKAAAANARALHAIFGAVDPDVYTLISECEAAKDAWDILQVTYEGTERVRESRLLTLTAQFENLKMDKDESVTDFNKRLMDIANQSHALGETISNERLVKKALRGLSQKFAMHKISILQTENLKTLKLEELMGTLKSYENELEAELPVKKNKGVALKGEISEADSDSDDEEMAVLVRNFAKYLRKVKKDRPEQSFLNRGGNSSKFRKNKLEEKNKSDDRKNKGIRCHACEGYGHILKECPTEMKRQRKSFVACLNESETDASEAEEEQLNCLALTTFLDDDTASENKSSSDSDTDIEINDETIEEKCREMYEKLQEVVKMNTKLKQEKLELSKTVEEMRTNLNNTTEELRNAQSELKRVNKYINMMGPGTKNLDSVLSSQRMKKSRTGLGYEEGATNGNVSFVKEKEKEKRVVEAKPVRGYVNHFDTRICYFCNKPGHIKRDCKLHATHKWRRVDPHKPRSQPRYEKRYDVQNQFYPKQGYKSRNHYCYVARSSVTDERSDQWLCDRGCSRHMTGDKSHLAYVKRVPRKLVTFGNGVKGKVIGSSQGEITQSILND